MAIVIVSGEGTGNGHRKTFTGNRTARAIRARLTKERCGGDRWAYVEIDGQRYDDKTELGSVLRGASLLTVKTGHLQSDDPTITVPDEVRELPNGTWIAVHEGKPDVSYASLQALENDYRIRVTGADPFARVDAS